MKDPEWEAMKQRVLEEMKIYSERDCCKDVMNLHLIPSFIHKTPHLANFIKIHNLIRNGESRVYQCEGCAQLIPFWINESDYG